MAGGQVAGARTDVRRADRARDVRPHGVAAGGNRFQRLPEGFPSGGDLARRPSVLCRLDSGRRRRSSSWPRSASRTHRHWHRHVTAAGATIAGCNASASCRSWQPSCSSWRAPPRARRPVHAVLRLRRPTCPAGAAMSSPGYVLCGHGAPPAAPTSRRTASWRAPGGAQAIWSQGRWEWTAPPGTTIVGGSLAYRTRMRHSQFFARVKMRTDGVLGRCPDARERAADDRADRPRDPAGRRLPAGRRRRSTRIPPPRRRDRRLGRLRHARAPRCDGPRRDAAGARLGRRRRPARWGLASRRRLRHLRPRRPESGVGAVWLASDGVSSAWAAPRTGSQYQPGAAWGQPTLCLSAAALGDGIHAGAVGGRDESGQARAGLPFTVRIDSHAATVRRARARRPSPPTRARPSSST